ncbi:unnamed protein product [Moneuplotes crassus]|uniref:Signal peptidase complex subunit 2 n=1 Tax=Euplotes crassus TaxID=5936 RepID=A0AAD2D5Z8_EUPCR|nr:unnamed protein product [Moneuplotes crassus]
MSKENLGKQVCLYDVYATKDAIDEEISFILESKDAQERSSYDYLKILLGFGAAGLGYISYFNYAKFPSGWLPSLVTILIYFVISFILSYIENHKEKDCFLEIEGSSIKELKRFDYSRFCSFIKDCDEHYYFALEGVKDNEVKRIEMEISITKLFDSEGYLHKDKVQELVFNAALKKISGKKN